MPQSKYIYNSQTLRYERAKISFLSVILSAFGIVIFSALFFVALVFIQNYFVETPVEKSLLAENKALSHYRVELASQLDLAKVQMSTLKSKDKSLYEKIFETKKIDEKSNLNTPFDKEILLADVSGFHAITSALLDKFTKLNRTARDRSAYFGLEASVKKSDVSFLASVPAYPPLASFEPSKLVSGYGMRINPFHKRNYHHDGLDIAAPRGTEVLAAAAGRVTGISYSDLQAGFGNYIEVDHGNGYVTRYANLGEIRTRYGQAVSKGQPIGQIGISGGSVAPHVHYEVLKNGRNVDPVKFLIQGMSDSQYEQIWQAAAQQNQSLD